MTWQQYFPQLITDPSLTLPMASHHFQAENNDRSALNTLLQQSSFLYSPPFHHVPNLCISCQLSKVPPLQSQVYSPVLITTVSSELQSAPISWSALIHNIKHLSDSVLVTALHSGLLTFHSTLVYFNASLRFQFKYAVLRQAFSYPKCNFKSYFNSLDIATIQALFFNKIQYSISLLNLTP